MSLRFKHLSIDEALNCVTPRTSASFVGHKKHHHAHKWKNWSAHYCSPLHFQHFRLLVLCLLVPWKLILTSVSDYCSSPGLLAQAWWQQQELLSPHPLPSYLPHLHQSLFSSPLLFPRSENSTIMIFTSNCLHPHTHTHRIYQLQLPYTYQTSICNIRIETEINIL